DRRQRLAAEAERADVVYVVAELRGAVALDAHGEIVRIHALAVVGNADEGEPAARGGDVEPRRAGVERVPDQLLDHAGRALDHLAGGDAVDDGFGKVTDGHEPILEGFASRWQGIEAPARHNHLSPRAAGV